MPSDLFDMLHRFGQLESYEYVMARRREQVEAEKESLRAKIEVFAKKPKSTPAGL
jgi:hypothetical protein